MRGCGDCPSHAPSGARTWHPTRLNHPVPAPLDVPELLQEVRGLSLIEVVDARTSADLE